MVDLDEGMFAVTALTENGQVYNWGYNQNHALGREHTKWYYSPIKLDVPEKITRIHSGISSTAALSESGTWYMWGDNTYGGLMTGDMEPVIGPVKIPTPEQFIDIAPGEAHCLALTAGGEVYLWGSYRVSIDELDGLVREVTKGDLEFRKIPFPEAVIRIEAGDRECYALTESGDLYAWGYNELGSLGLGKKDDVVQPLMPDEAIDEPTIVLSQVKDFSVSPEAYTVLAVTKSGDVYIWGQTGWDGNNVLLYSDYPEKIAFPEEITQVFCGDMVYYAVGQSGTIYTWGYNYFEKYGPPLDEPVPLG